MTRNEARYCDQIREKDEALRRFLASQSLGDPSDIRSWFEYLTSVKDILGNINNSIGFLATLLAKARLSEQFDLEDFDAAEKAQGAPGPDILARTKDGKTVLCEIKTTKPYQPGFGAQQKAKIKEDLQKLARASADHKLMFVTDADAFKTLCRTYWAPLAQGVDIVDLKTGETFRHP
jgi:hypothetical protein